MFTTGNTYGQMRTNALKMISHNDRFWLWTILYYGAYFISVILFKKEAGGSVLIDEIFAIIIFPFAIRGFIRLAFKPGILFFSMLVYFSFYLISTFVYFYESNTNVYPIEAAIQGVILEIKPFVYVLGIFDVLFQRGGKIHSAVINFARALVVLALLNSFFVVGDILSGQSSSIIGIPLLTSPLGYLPAGLFTHKYNSAVLTMAGCIAALALNLKYRRVLYILIAAYLLFVLTLHAAVKEILSAWFAVLIYFFHKRATPQRNAIFSNTGNHLLAVVIFIALAIGVFGVVRTVLNVRYKNYFLSYFISVRQAVYIVSAEIAKDKFPVGSGAGTYCSAPSRKVYFSDYYDKYGLSYYYGANPIYAGYLMDAWWPKILGESGVFGFFANLLFWGIGVVWMFRFFFSWRNSVSFFVVSLAAAVMFSSVAAAVFTSDVYMPIIGVIWGWVMAIRHGGSPPCLDK